MSPKLEQLVFVLFSKQLQTTDIEALWKSSGVAPEAELIIEKRSGVHNVRRVRGVHADQYAFVFGIAGDKAELRIHPPPPSNPEQEQSLIPHLSDASAAFEWTKGAALALLGQLRSEVNRIGLHPVWFWTFDDRSKCALHTSNCIPIDFGRLELGEGSVAEDFLLQYNSPKEEGAVGLTFNRIVNWQTHRANSAVLSTESGQLVQRSVDFWMLRCALDVNNAINADGAGGIDLKSQEPEAVLESVFKIAGELLHE